MTTRLLALDELARETGIPARRWRDWSRRGVGPRLLRVTERSVYVERAELDRWLEARAAATQGVEEPEPALRRVRRRRIAAGSTLSGMPSATPLRGAS